MSNDDINRQLQDQLAEMKQAQLSGGIPDAAVRKDRLQRCVDLLVDNQEELAAALDRDYGGRSRYITLMSEIMQGLAHYKHTIKNIDKWMKPEKRSAPFPMGLFGAKAAIRYQPKGVVAIMSPWNFPIAMVFNPLCNALAAGNRVMIKPSEFNPETADLMKQLIGKYFSPDEVFMAIGGPEVGAAFSQLPFDHILFTGATSIGRIVMQNAAKNLTPVTLELGGKSPVIIDADFGIEEAAEKIVTGKCLNAGQVCISPDYVFVPEQQLEQFIATAKDTFQSQYPKVKGVSDFPTIVNERHYSRIESYLAEAREAGVQVVALSDDSGDASDRKMAIHLLINPSEDLKVMQDEIFGPLVIIKTYSDVQPCIDYINARPSPLALYYFGKDKARQDWVLDNTLSGGVCINDVLMHVSCTDMPFGGVGESGVGNYHGHEGFKAFSHARGVFRQGRVNLQKLAGTLPPYTDKLDKMLSGQIKK